MIKGLRHTVMCSKCGETTIASDSYGEAENIINTEKSKCCHAPFEYIGLQIYNESILKNPLEFKADKIGFIKQEANEIKEETSEKLVIKEEIQEEIKKEVENNIENSKVIEEEVIAEDIQEVSILKIEDIVAPGPKGVTNGQMIPAIKQCIDEGSSVKLGMLKKHYPDVFEASLKYISNKYKIKMNDLMK